MPTYKYTARDRNSSQQLSGTIDAQTPEEAGRILHEKGLLIISLSPQTTSFFKRRPDRKVPIDHLVVFSRQIATLINSGITLVVALEILKDQIENPVLGNVISRIYQEIKEGRDFCDCMSKYPGTFSEFYISMVRAGEASGTLAEVLERLAIHLEKTAALRRKVSSSLVYPAVIIVMTFLITAVLLLKVVPTFKNIFTMLGGELPLPTAMLILISDLTRRFFFLFLIAVGFIGFILKRYINTPKGRFKFDKLLLRLPMFGTLFLKVGIAQFSRTFSTLVKSGIPVLTALEIVSKTTGNKLIEEAIVNCRTAVRQGEPFSRPLEKSGVFPTMVVKMIGVGEAAGELEKMLTKIADFYEEQVDSVVSGLTSIIEPVVIAFLGVLIGGIVLALFLPIFKITELVAR